MDDIANNSQEGNTVAETTEDTEDTEAIEDTEDTPQVVNPELSQIRSICKLATLECYYHNVAKATKEKGSGLTHIGEKDRKFWFEYSGTVTIGVDMSKGSMEVNGTEITIHIPEAEILNIAPDNGSISDTIKDTDSWWNKNKISADDTTMAMNDAQESIKKQIENNSSLLTDAQERAEVLIRNYIEQLNAAFGTEFTVNYVTIPSTSSDTTSSTGDSSVNE
jgi:hypothetical protein